MAPKFCGNLSSLTVFNKASIFLYYLGNMIFHLNIQNLSVWFKSGTLNDLIKVTLTKTKRV